MSEAGGEKPRTIYSNVFPAAFKRDATVVVKPTGERGTIASRGHVRLANGTELHIYRLLEGGNRAFTGQQIRPAHILDFFRAIVGPAADDSQTKKTS